MSSQSLSGWDFLYSILHCFDDFRSSCWSAQMTSLCISGLNFVLCLPVCIHGHSLALYLTQHHFSPSSSKLWMWFWFLCFVWRRWISFTQYLHSAHVMPTFLHPWVFYSSVWLELYRGQALVSFCCSCLHLPFALILSVPCFASCMTTICACLQRWSSIPPPGTSKKSNCLKFVAID